MTNLPLINYGLAFLEGFALIISPCILPILPIMLSGSIEGGDRRPIGIMVGFVLTFALFTLFSKVLVQSIGINLDLLRQISYGFIIVFGIILISDTLSELFSRFTNQIASLGIELSEKANPRDADNQQNSSQDNLNQAVPSVSIKKQGFISGLFLGILVSLIWVPCGGPILATAIVQTVVQSSNLQSFLVFFFFALGSVLPMMLIAFLGKKIIKKLDILKKHALILRKIFGFLIILGALISVFVGNTLVMTEINAMPEKNAEAKFPAGKLVDALTIPYKAPPLSQTAEWINSESLTLESLKGKVVLIDFWAYSCINCIRTLPYLRDWYQKYRDLGFVIIGVHTPEFEFEKNISNVKAAVKRYDLQYPIMIDNNYNTWLAFANRFWPAHYLIDKQGNIVYTHFGEGHYDITEHNIRTLLGLTEESNKPSENSSPAKATASEDLSELSETPETYLGFKRGSIFKNPQLFTKDAILNFFYAGPLKKDQWSLQGRWTINPEYIITEEKNAGIKIHFYARKVYAVMGSQNQKMIEGKVLLNGKVINTFTVSEYKLYEMAALEHPQEGELEIILSAPGVKLYTFTFGN